MSQVTGPYKINSFGMRLIAVLTNKCQQGPYRGFGSEVTNWVMERMTDAAADELKMDKVELRLMNMIQPNEFSYMIPTGNIYDSGNCQKVLSTAQTLIDYNGWKKRAADLRAQGRCVGVGLTTCQERSVYGPTEWWSLNNVATPGFTLTSTPEGMSLRIDPTGKSVCHTERCVYRQQPRVDSDPGAGRATVRAAVRHRGGLCGYAFGL